MVDLRNPIRRGKLLKAMPVEAVWGIGQRMMGHLNAIGINTAWDLANCDAWTLRKGFNVVFEKTSRQLPVWPAWNWKKRRRPNLM